MTTVAGDATQAGAPSRTGCNGRMRGWAQSRPEPGRARCRRFRAAMANDRKWVERRGCRTGRRPTPQGGVHGDRGDRHYAQDSSEACAHALLGPQGVSSRL